MTLSVLMMRYRVKQGDCIDSIAVAHGFRWETLWNQAENTALKQHRKDPFVLKPGDEVFVPELRLKMEQGQTETRHRFRRKGVPSLFRIQVCVADEPLAAQPYQAKIDGVWYQGTTDAQGWVEIKLPPDAKEGELTVGEGESVEYIELRLGCLDPINEISGVQQRLENIGFQVGEEGEFDEETQAAVAEFQQMMQLEPSGELTDETRQKLLEYHGS
jgi:hypothetical protein